jgi:transcriptional antiterminator NusG
MQDKFGQMLVPEEEVVEMRTARRAFPSASSSLAMSWSKWTWMMTWHLVKSTPKVTGFVGGTATKPTPISEKEVEKIMQQMQEGVEKPRPKVLFEVGEMVRIKEGPFTDFNGNVEEVNYEKSRMRVSVTILVARRRWNWSLIRSKRPEVVRPRRSADFGVLRQEERK